MSALQLHLKWQRVCQSRQAALRLALAYYQPGSRASSAARGAKQGARMRQPPLPASQTVKQQQ